MSMREIEAKDLKESMLVDLSGDCFADPSGQNPCLFCEYQIVMMVKQETTDSVAVGFEGFDTIGFPVDHKLKVAVDDQGKLLAP